MIPSLSHDTQVHDNPPIMASLAYQQSVKLNKRRDSTSMMRSMLSRPFRVAQRLLHQPVGCGTVSVIQEHGQNALKCVKQPCVYGVNDRWRVICCGRAITHNRRHPTKCNKERHVVEPWCQTHSNRPVASPPPSPSVHGSCSTHATGYAFSRHLARS